MSIEAWKEEFYPEPADEVSGTLREWVQHTLLKWKGLRQLEDYGLFVENGTVYDRDDPNKFDPDNYFPFSGNTCALCIKFSCETCPLPKFMKGRTCSREESPYAHFYKTGDPEPMIASLEALLQEVREQAGE